jgi:hypothetical protein
MVGLCNSPKLILFIPNKLIFGLVQKADMLDSFLDAASQIEVMPDLLVLIANHPNTPSDVINKLAEDRRPMISEAAKLHIAYTGKNQVGTELTAEENWRVLAESKINRSQLQNLKYEENIEFNLFLAGGIHEKHLHLLSQDEPRSSCNTLLRIVCSSTTDMKTINELYTNTLSSQFIKDCINEIKQFESLFARGIPSIIPAKTPDAFNHIFHEGNSMVDSLEQLLDKLSEKEWVQKEVSIEIKLSKLQINTNKIFNTKKYPISTEILYRNRSVDEFNRHRNVFRFRLSNIEYYGIVLAQHHQTSSEVLSYLTNHPISRVRALVAANPNTSLNSLNKLIDDCDSDVRLAALANPKTGLNTMNSLSRLLTLDPSDSELMELSNNENIAIRYRVAQHPNTTPLILSNLSNDKLTVRLIVAKNPKTPIDIILRFAAHNDQRLHLAVAQNAGAPTDLLIEMATRSVPRSGYYFSPINLFAIKTLLFREPEIALPFIEKCLKYPEKPSFSRFLLLMNPEMPTSFLSRHYKSWSWMERYAIAQNPNTGKEIRQLLNQDPNIIVRAAARNMLGNNSN